MSDFDKLFKNLNHHFFFFIKIRKFYNRFTSKAQFFTIGLQFSVKKKKILSFLYIRVFLLTAEPLHRSDDFPVWAIHGYSIPSLGHLSSKAQLLGIKVRKDVQHYLIREQFNASRFTTRFSQTFFILIRRRC